MSSTKQVRIESLIGRTRKAIHPPKDGYEDIWTMAVDFARNDFKTRD